jgi:hypothetical protein
MKMFCWLLCCFFLLENNTMAQDIKLGFKVGANLSDASGKAFKEGFNFGYQLGLFSELMVTKKYGIQPEILFSESELRPGTDFNSLAGSPTIDDLTKIKLQYLAIPVLFNYKPIPILAFQLGPQFGILMSQTQSLKDNTLDAFKNGDLAAVAGVQLTILKFRLYGRYALGTKNLNVQNAETWKSQHVQLGLGVTL